jgi:hypothetical protein
MVRITQTWHSFKAFGAWAQLRLGLGVKRPPFTMEECQICNDIWQLFTNPGNAKERVALWSPEQALAPLCPKHTVTLEWIRIYFEDLGEFDPSEDIVLRRGQRDSIVHFSGWLESGWYRTFELLLVKNEDIINHPGTARILDEKWINMDLLRHWTALCCDSHGSCSTAMNTALTVPALLVDVKRKCVVSGISGYRYVALSYRFGEAAHFSLNRGLLDRLRYDFALDNPDILDRLPLTVRHAIALVEALGESYLWTDSLCITHEDSSTLAGQLEQMAGIYSSALLTIVATDGDGTSGILGLPGISQPREPTQQVFRFGAEHLAIHEVGRHGLANIEDRSAYHTRGWTYQEFLMSARKLVFMEGQAHWMCQCREWHEELARDVELKEYISPRPQLLVAGFPDLASLEHLLNDYNKRSLTYDEDALPAIAGLLSVLSRTFTGGFLYGLPEMMFDTALGWNLSYTRTKRVLSQPVRHDQNIPTWSWLSFPGKFSWGDNETLEVVNASIPCSTPGVFNMIFRFQETSPITEWYASIAPKGEPRRKIVPTWYKERERAKDPRQPLADGWSRREATTVGLLENETRVFPDGCGAHVYEHRDAPATGRKLYWYYPFRVPSVEPSTPFCNPTQMQYLFCKTFKSTVLACKRYDYHGSNWKNTLYLQGDVDGPVIGTLHLQTDEQLDRWSKPEDSTNENAKLRAHLIEVVAINRAVVFSNRCSEPAGVRCTPVTRKEYVTVLWVEWEGIVALRQACGRVECEAWEALDLEEIDLVLG